MSQSTLIAGIRQLRGKLALHGRGEESDEQLLQSFLRCRDDSAFAALVRRHGPMVFHACRRILGHHQDAEDAFQATFLALSQQAASVREQTSLAGFLHGIAVRTALKARQSASRRRKHEMRTCPRSPSDPMDELLWREVRSLLDEEIARLPEIYRGAFVLCCLQGVSGAEAARRLGVKEGTVSSRLTAARKLLQRRLARRGVELTAVLAAVAVATPTTSALPIQLAAATTKAALAMIAGGSAALPPAIAALMKSSSPILSLGKTKLAMLILLTVATSGSLVTWYGLASGPLAATMEPPAAKTEDKAKSALPQREAAKTEEIRGRVLDADGQPVKDARLHWSRFIKKDAVRFAEALEYVERGRSDGEGHFRIQLPSDSLRTLIVTAPGHSLNWVELPKGKSSGEWTVRLSKDARIRGRVVSTEGQPLAGVSVRVDRLEEMANERLDKYLAFWEQDWNKINALKTRRLEVPIKQSILPPVITDNEGRFQLRGVGSERIVYLDIQGKDIAHSIVPVVARPGFDPSALNKTSRSRTKMSSPFAGQPPVLYGLSFDFVALPARIVQGIVREAGSGKPIPGVRIYGSGGGNRITDSMAITDQKGRYRLEGLPKMERYPYLAAEPPWDSSWLPTSIQNKEAGEGMRPVQVNFTLGRGVILTGQVIDRTTGKGVASSIAYDYLPDNKFAGKPGYHPGGRAYGSDAEGRFRIKVVPGTGVLKAHALGAANPYLPAQFDAEDRKHIRLTTDGDFVTLGGIGFLAMYNAVKRLDLAPDAGEVKLKLYPRRGATAAVHIEDPDGRPLAGVAVSGIDAIPGQHSQGAYVSPTAECTITALEPQRPRQVIFYHAARRLACSLIVRGDEKEPLTARLTPTGSVIGRLRNADGQPIQGAEVEIWAKGPPASPSLVYLYLGLNRTRLPVRTDKDGRFRLKGVVPDGKFDIDIRHRGRYANVGSRTKKLSLKAGETLDLGEMVIKPAE